MADLTLPLTIILLFITLVVTILFYRRISKANDEYEEAKNIVGDITMSFGRRMRRQENGIRSVAERVDILASRDENVLRGMDEHEMQLAKITDKAEKVLQSRSKMMGEVKAIEEKLRQATSTQKTIKQKIEATEERARQKIEQLEKARSKRARTRAKQKIITAISIKSEKALAHLTEYQVKILEILATEGEKTAPEMKKKIGITREHTARLMRRLYDEGYVERDMRKMPYIYRIKEEAREILTKE